MSTSYTALIRMLPLEDFQAILQSTSRQAREALFARHHIRAPKARPTAMRSANKNVVRGERLFEVLASEKDEPLAEEMLRVFLLGQRPLLAKALDLLKIPHEDGLTDSPELQRLAKMSDKEADKLIAGIKASEVPGHAHAPMYVAFMRYSLNQESDED